MRDQNLPEHFAAEGLGVPSRTLGKGLRMSMCLDDPSRFSLMPLSRIGIAQDLGRSQPNFHDEPAQLAAKERLGVQLTIYA